jgi:hypothetical protein
MKLFNTNPRPGWARTTEVVGPEVTVELSRLSSENARLRGELESALAREQDKAGEQEERAIRALRRNSVEVSYRRKGSNEWTKGPELTLYNIFQALAPYMLSEQPLSDVLSVVAWTASRVDPSKLAADWPIPKNTCARILADLTALGLIQPSTKKHSVHDKQEYWMLASLGRDVYMRLRRARLDAGLNAEPTLEEVGAPASTALSTTELVDPSSPQTGSSGHCESL